MINLPSNTFLGTLEIRHVYEFYDGPRLFNAINTVGTNYIVYWIDTDNVSDQWLFSSISEQRLKLLETKEIKLRDVFTYPEESVYKVGTPFDLEHEPDIVRLRVAELIDDILPPANFYIEKSDNSSNTIEPNISNVAISELYIKKRSGKSQPPLNAVAKITAAWSEIYKSVLRSLEFNTLGLTPIDARSGSFILRMSSPKFDECLPIIEELFNILNNVEDPYQQIMDLGINIEPIESLLAEIADGKVILQLNRDETFVADLNIDAKKATSTLSALKEHTTSYISSLKVPQANAINKVFHVVELKAGGKEIEPSDLELTTGRQVTYYVHAARMLGFLNNSNAINSAGFQFSKMNTKRRMNAAAIRFESSDCGWSWLKWSDASTICEIAANSAEEFLLQMCPTLSESTAKRRAKTLNRWLSDLTEYRFIDNN